jgi:uncharacterized protein (DUF1501 family)
MLTRRHFLRNTSLIAFSPLLPAFLPRAARAVKPDADGRVLVVIQMEGGNDGINTLVPFADEGYARNRSALRLKESDLLKLNDRVALHPAMRGVANLMEDHRLAIVQGVGYPNPSRSHFRSMATWQTARGEGAEWADTGWLGTALDGLPRPIPPAPDAVYVGPGDLPRAVIGRRSVAAAIASAGDLALRLPVEKPMAPAPAESEDLAAFVRRTMLTAYCTAGELAGTRTSDAIYPRNNALAAQLQLVSSLLRSGSATRVYYTSQDGYDTHSNQLPRHADLLDDFSRALKAFLDDLKDAGLSQRVLVLAFSEFGRRVAENSSQGTDHGTANPVYLAGDAVKPGLMGDYPSLLDLKAGDLKSPLDFRGIYAAILQDWLRVPPAAALGGSFAALPIIRGM